MELTPLQTAIAGNVLASGVLAFAFFYLWLQRRQMQAPIFWGAAYLCYCIRQVLILAYAPTAPVAADFLFILVPLLILAGTLRFLDRRVPYGVLAGLALVLMLGAVAGHSDIVTRATWLRFMLGAGVVTLWATGGFLLVQSRRRPEREHLILATLFVLWGLILGSFPFLMHDLALRVPYYFANAVALLLVALTLIIASQRQQYREAQSARIAAETANQRFQDIVDTATAWIWEWDSQRRIRFISPQVFDSLGIKPELFIGRRFREVPGIAEVHLTVKDADRIFTAERPFRNVPIDVVTIAGRRARISVSGKPTYDDKGRHTGFRGITIDITQTSRTQTALDAVTGAIAQSVGPDYFRALVERLARDLGVDMALVGRCLDDGRVHALAAYGEGAQRPEMEYALSGAPCATTLADGFLIVERDAARLYPEDSALAERGLQGYAGVALRGASGRPIGLIALLTKAPISDTALIRTVLQAIAPRAGAEMERQVAETALRESEALFRTVIDNMPIGFHLTDTQGRFILRNATLNSWTKDDGQGTIGRTLRETADQAPLGFEVGEAELREVVATGLPMIRDRVVTHSHDGQPRQSLICRFPVFDAGRHVAFVGTLITDTTELKQLQRQIEERESLLRAILDNMPAAFYLTDAEGRFVLHNRTLSTWSGNDWTPQPGYSLREIAASLPFDGSPAEAELRQVRETGRPLVSERDFMPGSPRARPTLISHFPIRDESGRLAFVGSLATDLTDLKRLEAQVREREAMFRTVLDNMPVAFHLTDAEGRMVQSNRTLSAWGNEVEMGRTFSEMDINIPAEDRSIVDAEIREVRETGRTLVRERTDLLANGQQRPVLVCRFPIHDSAGGVSLVGTMVTDVSALKSLEDQVRQSETRLQRVVSALDRSRKGVVVEDAENRPIYINRTAGELMGTEASAVTMLQRAGIGSEFESHGAWSGEVIHRTRSGGDAILQASISRLPDGGSVTLLDDATERLERERRQVTLERQVQEAQKMDAVGQLAGGIAHDFNNLIGAILGFSRFIADDTEPQSRIHGYAERILSASKRARDLVQQILAFSRRENAPRQPASLARLVEESAGLLRATLPSTLTIEVRNDFPEAWSIVNPTQITQILVNLCLNAADAMGGQPGTLTLALERVPDVDPRLRWLLASDPGGRPKLDLAATPAEPNRCYVGALETGCSYLVLSVRDEGSGISPETLAKIFDPFFTTKARGQGTGLGLPVVQRLVLAHDGAIVVTTRPGQGTTFDIMLPMSGRSTRDVVDAINRSAGDEPAAEALAGRSRVLVVDDDLHFGDMVSTALDRAGYEVGVCARPREALDVFSEQPQFWDVVVTDQTMPEMSGLEMIGRLKTLNPRLRCILCTGYASSSLNAQTAKAGGADVFFHKPVDVSELLSAVAAFAGTSQAGDPR